MARRSRTATSDQSTVLAVPEQRILFELDDVNDEKHLSKANDAIGLRVKAGQLSLLSRKIFNILVFHAQQQQTPGQGAPADFPGSEQYYWVPLNEVAKDANYNSKDVDVLKRAITELAAVRVIQETQTLWRTEGLIASALIHVPNKRGRGHESILGFMFPPGVQELLLQPSHYTKLSLFYQGQFRSGVSLALYELTLRYLGNPSKLTRREPWQWWFSCLSGTPIDPESPPEYKYFKSRTLKRAMDEVNALTNIRIGLIEHKKGRTVQDLQFTVEPSDRIPQLEDTGPVIDVDLLKRLMKFGVRDTEAIDLIGTYGHATVTANLELTEKRMRSNGLAKLKTPRAYLKHAIRDNYAASEELEKSQDQAPQAQMTPMEKLRISFIAARTAKVGSDFNRMSQEEQAALIEQFEQTERFTALPETVKTKFKQGERTPLWENSLWSWLSTLWYEEPTTEDLIDFAAEQVTQKK